MKIEKLKPGMTIYKVKKATAWDYLLPKGDFCGDFVVFEGVVKEVDASNGWAKIAWKHEPDKGQFVLSKEISRYRFDKPEAK